MNLIKISNAVFIAVVLASCSPSTSNLPTKPNILFIAVDDLRPDLGCYGKAIVHSPNLDQLASEAFLFNNHYTNVPTCGPSRYCLLTGTRPISRKHLSNNISELVLQEADNKKTPESFIHLLREEGYYTSGIGKISHSADGYLYGYEDSISTSRELPLSWDELDFDYGKWGTGWNAFFAYANGENRQSLNKQVKPYESGDVDDLGYPDGLTRRLAQKKLKALKAKDQPFFLGVGFFKPHLPFTAPKRYWDLYEESKIPISLNPGIPKDVSLASLHHSGEFNQYQLGEEKASLGQSVSDAYARKLRHAYYACISYIDEQIGYLIKDLKDLGIYENTVIVVWGDHGWHLGDQRVWGKHTIFEHALKSTLLIKVPSMAKGQKIDAIVETVDIYPTIMDLCGIGITHHIDGTSKVPLMDDGPEDDGENYAYGYFRNGISLRTDRYRMTKYYRKEQPQIELYDHSNDPLESINIAEQNPSIIDSLMPILELGNTGLYE